MARNHILSLFIIISLSISKSHSQTNLPSASLLCISDCETCPVICSPPSPPPSPKFPPPSPKIPPLLPLAPQSPPVHRYSPPQPYYYFTAPPPSPPPPPRSKPPPPSYTSLGGATPPPPPPPPVYVYNPSGNPAPARNLSYPYYYFYAANGACGLPFFHGSFIFLMMFVFYTNFV